MTRCTTLPGSGTLRGKSLSFFVGPPRSIESVGGVCGQNPGLEMRRMSVYSLDERMKAVQLYFQYDRNLSAVIRELGYPSKGPLKQWVAEYEATGPHIYRPPPQLSGSQSNPPRPNPREHTVSPGVR